MKEEKVWNKKAGEKTKKIRLKIYLCTHTQKKQVEVKERLIQACWLDNKRHLKVGRDRKDTKIAIH